VRVAVGRPSDACPNETIGWPVKLQSGPSGGSSEGVSTEDFRIVLHDPYGAYHPSLLSKNYGKERWVGGMSLVSGGGIGPRP
jgi:hypothetical protein